MIAQVLRLTRWEWFKGLRRRWLPWILLGIIVVIAQSFLWSTYISYETTDFPGGYSLHEEGERVLDPTREGWSGPSRWPKRTLCFSNVRE